MPYSCSGNLLDRLLKMEGFRAKPYQDPGGIWTIGYGRLCQKDAPFTTPDAEKAWVRARLVDICHQLEGLFGGEQLLLQEVDALASFIYNIGLAGFKQSNVYRLLKARDTDAFVWWKKWRKSQTGEVLPGLVKRRHFETTLFVWGWAAADQCEL